MLTSLWISFTDWDGLSPTSNFVGLANYVRFVAGDSVARRALINNVLWTIGTILSRQASAWCSPSSSNSRHLIGRNLIRAMFYMPAVVPLVAIGIIWAWIVRSPTLALSTESLRSIGLSRMGTWVVLRTS